MPCVGKFLPTSLRYNVRPPYAHCKLHTKLGKMQPVASAWNHTQVAQKISAISKKAQIIAIRNSLPKFFKIQKRKFKNFSNN